MFYFPSVFGSVQKGKAIWKYHRASGYVVWTMILGNCILGTQSTWFLMQWDITSVWVLLGILALLGVFTRVRFNKMKFV
jgi:cytochrome b-561